MKTCSGCLEEKPVEEFHIDRGLLCQRKPKCRLCTNKIKAAWRRRNANLIRSRRREEYARNREHYMAYMNSDKRRERLFRWKLERKFGITRIDFDRMVDEQDGCCAICLQPPSTAKGHSVKHRLHVDHCHKTGKVRGLLCNNCNAALGYFADDTVAMARAIRYLKQRRTANE